MRTLVSALVLVQAIATLVLAGAPAAARDHFVAPLDSAPADGADGSADAPWRSTRSALASGQVESGDRLILLPGAHGHIDIVTDTFDPPVLVTAAEPEAVQIDRITVSRGRGITFRGLQVWPSRPEAADRQHVGTTKATARIRLENMDIRGTAAAPARYLSWTLEDWRAGPGRISGVGLAGPDSALIDSRLTGVNFGVTVHQSGLRAEIRGNRVTGFAGDAFRGLSDDSVFIGNRAENCFKVNDNHDDAFQSWAPKHAGGAVRGLLIEDNVFLEWTAGAHPLRCTLQGIALFDGPYENVTVRNNIVAVGAYHGIALYNTQGAKAIHNTVVHVDGLRGGRPWIMLGEKSTAERVQSRDNLVAGNIAHQYRSGTTQPQPISKRSNALIGFPIRQFPGLPHGDLRLPADSPFLDGAPVQTAPPRDILGTARPQGAGPDFGAHERIGGQDRP